MRPITPVVSFRPLKHAVVVGYPITRPQTMLLADLQANRTYRGSVPELVRALAGYDVIAGPKIRTVLRNLGFTIGHRRVVDLSPKDRTMPIDEIIWDTCGVNLQLSTPQLMKITSWCEGPDSNHMRSHLSDLAHGYSALYAYGRLHGVVRYRDGVIPVKWRQPDDPRIEDLAKQALEGDGELEVVIDGDWERCPVVEDSCGYAVMAGAGEEVPLHRVQQARLPDVRP